MRCRSRTRRDADHEEAHEHADVSERVDHEALGFAIPRDDDPGDRRADQTSGVRNQRGQRHCVRQIFLAADELDQVRVAHRQLDCNEDAHQHGQRDDVPWREDARHCQRSQRDRLQHLEDLRREHHAMQIPAVGPQAGERREQQNGNAPGETEHAEKRGRAGQAVEQPALRDRLHPVADERKRLARCEERKVAVTESAQNPHVKESPYCEKSANSNLPRRMSRDTITGSR